MKEVLTITPQATLKRVAANLGLKTLPKMQGTTRAVYDTVALPAAAGGSAVFFDGVGARPFPASNITTNRFEVNSALAVQAIAFYVVQDNGADPAIISQLAGSPINRGFFDLIIGNQTVLKKTPINGGFQQITGRTNGSARNKMWLQAPIVIPPQVRYKVETRNLQAAAGTLNNITCVLYGTGVLLNTKTAL